MSDIRPARHRAAAGLLTAAAGTALLIWFVWKAGPGEIWNGFLKVGWGLAVIVLLGGLRFGARAAAWVLCIEPPHRLAFLTAFNAVVSGDAMSDNEEDADELEHNFSVFECPGIDRVLT